MKKMLTAIVMVIMMLASTASASVKTIDAYGAYQMGENDSIASAKTGAKNDALRHAAEQAGVYVRAYSKTQNYQLTDDEVEVVATNVMKVKSTEYTQYYANDTLIYYVHVVVTVDDSKFSSLIKSEKKRLELERALAVEKERNKDIKSMQLQHGTDVSTETELVMDTAYIARGDYSKAVINLCIMINGRAGYAPARAYYLRSVAYLATKRYSEALADITKAISIEGNSPLYYTQEALVRLAISQQYMDGGQYSQAKSQWYLAETKADTAMSFKRNYYPALYARSIARYMQDTIRKSVNDSEAAVKKGGRGLSYIENFNSYIHAQYNGRHKHMARQDVMDFLKEGAVGIMNMKNHK